jgi:GT2 family glycosyltransferase
MKTASIIVLTAGFSNDYTKKCLDAIEANTSLPYELFVLRDDKDYFGFSKDNNRIMRISEGKYIVLVNDDCFVHPQWLERMVRKAEEDPKIGIVGARLTGPEGILQYSVEKALPNGDVESVAFALVLIKRELISKIGLLNELYRYGSEDSEYCRRAWKSGFRCVISNATATHLKNMNNTARSIALRSKGGYFFRRSIGESPSRIIPTVAYDSTYPFRKFILKKAPKAFFKLRRIKVKFLIRSKFVEI